MIFLAGLLLIVPSGCSSEKPDDGNPTSQSTSGQVESSEESNSEAESSSNEEATIELLSKEEVAKVLGIAVAESRPSGNANVISKTEYSKPDHFLAAEIHLIRGASAKGGFDSQKNFGKVEAIEELGMEALWLPTKSLAIYDDGVFLTIRAEGALEGERKEKSIEIGKLALERAK
ncbi:MAG: hypothetical protein HON04_04060 [Planctomicrobium sp.]|nr:hypothetical protein [Planctomicrobium sp.]